MYAVAYFMFIFYFKLSDNTYRIEFYIKFEISVVTVGLKEEHILLLTWTYQLF